MKWIHEPGKWAEENDKIIVQAEPGTDIWRQPIEGGIRDSVHRYVEKIKGDFTASVRFKADYAGLYDQVGLFVGLNDTVWMKCGVELVHNVKHASAVVTRGWSDWSIQALDDSEWVWIRVERKDSMLFVYFSLDGEEYFLMRKAYFTDEKALDVGIMAGSPKGKGFTAVFEGLTITAG